MTNTEATATRDHAAETTTQVRAAIDTLLQVRVDAYATGEEVGAEVDYAIEGLRTALRRIETGRTGTPTAVSTR